MENTHSKWKKKVMVLSDGSPISFFYYERWAGSFTFLAEDAAVILGQSQGSVSTQRSALEKRGELQEKDDYFCVQRKGNGHEVDPSAVIVREPRVNNYRMVFTMEGLLKIADSYKIQRNRKRELPQRQCCEEVCAALLEQKSFLRAPSENSRHKDWLSLVARVMEENRMLADAMKCAECEEWTTGELVLVFPDNAVGLLQKEQVEKVGNQKLIQAALREEGWSAKKIIAEIGEVVEEELEEQPEKEEASEPEVEPIAKKKNPRGQKAQEEFAFQEEPEVVGEQKIPSASPPPPPPLDQWSSIRDKLGGSTLIYAAGMDELVDAVERQFKHNMKLAGDVQTLQEENHRLYLRTGELLVRINDLEMQQNQLSILVPLAEAMQQGAGGKKNTSDGGRRYIHNLDVRTAFNKVMNEAAHRHQMDYAETTKRTYNTFDKAEGRPYQQEAKAKGMIPLDYYEEVGVLEKLHHFAKEMWFTSKTKKTSPSNGGVKFEGFC